MQTTIEKTKAFFTQECTAITVIMAAGVILRLRQYLTGRSLWVDEAMLALNIVNRNFIGLFKPLDYDQGAPIGFLLIEKFFNILLGRNEYVLRLFPLILGLLSLWVFYLLLKRFTSGPGLVISLALFAFNPRLIYYSSEVKQYIADVFVTISLLLVVTQFFENPSRKKLGILAFAGFLALWFSHPSVFLLAGIGVTLLFSQFQKRDFANTGLVIGMGVFWLLNVGFLYSLTFGDLQNNSYMREYWQGAFAPMPPWSNWGWYWDNFQANVNSHLAISFAPGLVLFLMLTGWIVLFQQKRQSASMIAWMLFFTLFASSLGLYPSLERMVLFLTPAGILLIDMALGFIHKKLHGYLMLSVLITAIISVYLFYGAIPRTFEQFVSPTYFEHIRPAMGVLQDTWQDGDMMYISNGAIPAFEYYAPMYKLENIPYVAGSREDYGSQDEMLKRLEPLKGQKRVWVLFSHVYEKGDFNEKNFLIDYLKKNGDKKREFREPGTSVILYLFDLSQ
jgi:hypothetical protein